MKTVFLILGAQRSGTSATSHILSKLGINFGDAKSFIKDEHNPIFFELDWVNHYNNKLINSLGYKYTDFFLPLEQDFENSEALKIQKELQMLIENEWNEEPIIGIKDPRFSLTLSVWQEALLNKGYEIKIIFVFRCPSNFLRSNKKLLHNWEGWDDETHLNFWLQLNLAAIYFARHFPICFVNYDGLMKEPVREIEKLALFSGLDPKRAVDASDIVQSQYCHHKLCAETGNFLVDQYYKSLCSQTISATDYLSYRTSVFSTTAPLIHSLAEHS